MATTGKIVEVLFENALETHELEPQLIELTTLETPDAAMMQNSGEVQWRTVDQHADLFSGFDATGQESEIIEETYPRILGTPTNDLPKQRLDKLRDMRFWERRGKESGRQQARQLNKQIATAMAQQAGMYYRSNATSGFDFLSEAEVMMTERQLARTESCFMINPRDMRTFATDLAARQTIKGRPEDTWKTGQIGSGVSEFDGIYTGNYLPNILGGAASTTVTGSQSFKPEGGTVDQDAGTVTNVDYRNASIVVADSSVFVAGSKVNISNGGVPVKALGLSDKTDTGEAMTFTVKSITDATHIVISPKPIAHDDSALTRLEKQYANIDTVILNAATVDRINVDASKKVNLFWDKSAVEVIGGTMPVELFGDMAGKKYISETLANGLEMYMIYDGDILTLDFRFRIFTWYGITIANPSAVGVATTYS